MTPSEAVSNWRRTAKQRIVAGFGGKCGICGYSRCVRALHLHHVGPSTKKFNFSSNGMPRAWKTLIDEAMKCVLLCSNCHAEVHDGIIHIPETIQRLVPPDKSLPLRRTNVRRRKNEKILIRKAVKVPNRPRGRDLQELARKTSKVAIAKSYGVSETAVRKWLKSDSRNGIY